MNSEELLHNLNGNQDDKGASPLKSLEADLKLYNESIREVAVEIMVEGLSAYPIFVAHQHEVKLGELILDRHELNTEWTIQASTLEEFMERGVINKALKQRFIDNYKNPHDYMCLFVIVPEGANFVFYPYKEE
ncbi:hypothetical protein GCM10027037_33070 [Mucilaginibacter koreensis]